MKTAFERIKMQIYILLYEIETNYTHLKPPRVPITNINTVLDDDFNQMREWNRNTEETPRETLPEKKKSNSYHSYISKIKISSNSAVMG